LHEKLIKADAAMGMSRARIRLIHIVRFFRFDTSSVNSQPRIALLFKCNVLLTGLFPWKCPWSAMAPLPVHTRPWRFQKSTRSSERVY